MKFSIKENSKNYACSVVEIKQILPIEGADLIVKTIVNGNTVVCSKNVKEGDRMLYFVSGTKLSEDYCKFNNLYDKPEENSDTTQKGFISFKNRRIKCLKLKGVISDGMLMPLLSLAPVLGIGVNLEKLKVGDEFTDIELNGRNYSICEKYIITVKEISRTSGVKTKQPKLKELLIDNQFRFHHETEHFVKHQDKFKEETEIIITRKLHGSSLILSNVLITKKLSLIDKISKFFGASIPTEEYGIIWSSGKPKGKLPKGIESKTNKWETPNPSYYTSDIWARAYKEIGHVVEKGVSIYGEIVGKGIQGDLFTYNQDFGIYIYRITQTSVDGNVVEFSWEQLKKYCEKYELNYVEEYFVGKIKEFAIPHDNLLQILQERYLNKSYPDCKYDEGIVVRIRDTDELFKLKSPNFILQEDKNLENDIPNIEDN